MKIPNEYNDLPQEEIIKMMENMVRNGFICHIKWSCENCGERVTCSTPNAFFTEGYFHEDCGFTSFPERFGLVVMRSI